MLSPLRNRFGIPGVISVVALVFAMLGGAYAAQNSGDGKATSSAKAKRGPKGPKGATGPAGPAGPAGPQGPAGANGKDGANGSNGSQGPQGLPGKSVAVGNYSGPECPGSEEGATVEVSGEPATKKYVCDGAEGAQGPEGPEGSPWTDLGTLPSGETLMGTWTVGRIPTAGALEWIPISFTIPLASDLASEKAHFIDQNGKEVAFNESTFEVEELASHPNCPGTAVSPAALSGHLCLYAARESGLKKAGPPAESGIYGAKPGAGLGLSTFFNATTNDFGFGVSKAGAAMKITAMATNANARGTWAVTG